MSNTVRQCLLGKGLAPRLASRGRPSGSDNSNDTNATTPQSLGLMMSSISPTERLLQELHQSSASVVVPAELRAPPRSEAARAPLRDLIIPGMRATGACLMALRITEHDLTGFVLRTKPAAGASLVVLNSRSFGPALLERLWRTTTTHICADGGANRLFDTLSAPQRLIYVPCAIVGDLDSARDEVTAYYRANGTLIESVENQDSNDLDKALEVVRRTWSENGEQPASRTVSVLGAFGGRFDQEMACFNSLYRFHHGQMRLYSDTNVATLLRPGTHTIRVRPSMEGPHCGLIPLGGRCDRVKTSGLRWNLDHAPLEFGELVSTSNLIKGEGDVTEVSVETSHPLIWTSTWRLDGPGPLDD